MSKLGRVCVIGSRGPVEINPRDLMGRRASIHGLSLFNATEEEKKDIVQFINKALEDKTISGSLGNTYKLDQVSQTHLDVINQTGGSAGKLILQPWE